LSYLADSQTDKQTNKQTKTGKNITSLAEVNILLRLHYAVYTKTFDSVI